MSSKSKKALEAFPEQSLEEACGYGGHCGYLAWWWWWVPCARVVQPRSLSHTTYYRDHRPRPSVIWLDSNLPHFIRMKTISDCAPWTRPILTWSQFDCWQILNRTHFFPQDEWYLGPGVGGKNFPVFFLKEGGAEGLWGGGLWAVPHALRYLPILRGPLPTNIEYLSLVPLELHIWMYIDDLSCWNLTLLLTCLPNLERYCCPMLMSNIIEYPGRWKNKAKKVHDYKLLEISFHPNFPLHYFLEPA